MDFSNVKNFTIPEGTVTKITNAAGNVLWSGLSNTFANNSWSDIIAACESGSVPTAWAVGNSKTMTINGADYQIDIIGCNHDTYAAGGTAPLTFQMHCCYDTAYAMTSSLVTTWEGSDMRTTYLPAILALMPSEVQAGIKEVSKVTGATTTSDKLFLLTLVEIIGESTLGQGGSQYAYYSAGGSTVKYPRTGTAKAWWTRSVSAAALFAGFYTIGTDGSTSTDMGANSNYVSFAFCF